MTLNEITYSIKEDFNAFSDDNITLSNEYIAFLVKIKRAVYLRNMLSNLKREIPIEAKQLICIGLEIDPTLCEDGYIFLRGTNKIPATLEATGRMNIADIYLNSRISKWLNIIDYSRLPYLKSGGRFNNKQIYFTVDPDSYPIVYSPSNNHELLEEFKLNIVAEDPEEAYKLQCNVDANSCDYYDSQFQMPADMISDIRKEILNELLLKYRIPTDTINNAEDDTVNKNSLDARKTRRTKE